MQAVGPVVQVGTQTDPTLVDEKDLQLIIALTEQVLRLKAENAWLKADLLNFWEGGWESLRWAYQSLAFLWSGAFFMAYSSMAGTVAALRYVLGAKDAPQPSRP